MSELHVQEFSSGDTIKVTYETGTELIGVARQHNTPSWWIDLAEFGTHKIRISDTLGDIEDAIVSVTVVKRALPPEPPLGSIVAVTIRGDLYAMQRYEQGWYCNRHRMGGGYVLINGTVSGVGQGGSSSWSATPPCPNCPDTWDAMHATSSPIRVLYWKGDTDGS